MISRQYRALFMAVLFLVTSVFPAKPAKAIVPVAIALTVLDAAGAAIASTASGLSLAAVGKALVGGAAMAVILSTSGDSSTNEKR